MVLTNRSSIKIKIGFIFSQISIGFLPNQDQLESYKQLYDIVIIDQGSSAGFQVIIELINLIIQGKLFWEN
jgi:hypothetical protein